MEFQPLHLWENNINEIIHDIKTQLDLQLETRIKKIWNRLSQKSEKSPEQILIDDNLWTNVKDK